MDRVSDHPVSRIAHTKASLTYDHLKRFYGPTSGVTYRKEFFNFTNEEVIIHDDSLGRVIVPPTESRLDAERGVYIAYSVLFAKGKNLVYCHPVDNPMLYRIMVDGELKSEGTNNVIFYVQFISEHLLDNGVLHEPLSGLYIGKGGHEGYSKVGMVTGQFQQQKAVAKGHTQSIRCVHEYREHCYLTGFKSVAPLAVERPHECGLAPGIYVTVTSSTTHEPEVKFYPDAKSCRESLDVPLFERYDEAEAHLNSQSDKGKRTTGKTDTNNARERASRSEPESKAARGTSDDTFGKTLNKFFDSVISVCHAIVVLMSPSPIKK